MPTAAPPPPPPPPVATPARRPGPGTVVGALVVALVVVAATVVVVVLVDRSTEPEAVRAPAAPADLCAVIGTARLEAWVVDAELAHRTSGNELNTESSCAADTADGAAADGRYGSLSARVYRRGTIGDEGGAAATAEDLAQRCQGHEGTDIGPGEESCTLIDEEDSSGTGHVQVVVRQGADLVLLSHFARPLPLEEAEARVDEAVAAILAELR